VKLDSQTNIKLASNMEIYIQELIKRPGIVSAITIPSSFYNLESASLSELIIKIISFLRVNNASEYSFDFLSIGKAPFHKKAIQDRLKKKKFSLSPNSKFKLYLEVNSLKGQNLGAERRVIARIGRKFIPPIYSTETIFSFSPQLILYSPYTVQEVADFFRLSLAFKIPIILTDENGRAEKLIEKVTSSYYKGINKINYRITSSLAKFINESKNKTFGFSLWGTSSIADLIPKVKNFNLQFPDKKLINFVFGNEETGLPLNIQNKIKMFRIGTQASEPLRASQAAAYVLGTLLSK
jgi:tRNA(Leu) C34 or U34 (ribose-2'-O)-methylase TrmL